MPCYLPAEVAQGTLCRCTVLLFFFFQIYVLNVSLVYALCICLFGAYRGHERVFISPEPELQISCPKDWGLNLGPLQEEGVFLTSTSSVLHATIILFQFSKVFANFYLLPCHFAVVCVCLCVFLLVI